MLFKELMKTKRKERIGKALDLLLYVLVIVAFYKYYFTGCI